jgi:glutathione synthase/RimK-type ligase-like ATP-grasp enzyme
MRLSKRLCIVPYKRFSSGARILAKKLNVYRMPTPDLVRGGHHVINWGNTNWEVPLATRVYNKPQNVAIAVNKLDSYRRLAETGVRIPEFTTDIETARQWAAKSVVMCRTLLEASEGRGIVVAEKPVDIVPAKVYTKYVRKKREYRVHVFQGKCIGVKRKIRPRAGNVADVHVRSHANGYRYILDPAHPATERTITTAIAAVDALGLDFGGVDVAWVEKGDTPYVLEVNTAPGLTDMTGDWYAKAFLDKYK